jgi:DtxR family transcriptional regulator, Mn-dependent transcriptional regulator
MNPLLFLAAAAIVLGVLVWPRHGILARFGRARELAQRTHQEDVLKHIVKNEANGRSATLHSIAGALQITNDAAMDLMKKLEGRGLLSVQEGRLRLSPAGRELGLHIVRAHRLWESYLAEETGVVETEWHTLAEKKEHLLTRQEADALAARLGYPTRDPHGDPIPNEQGKLEGDAGHSLNEVAPDQPLLITHIEDEPSTAYQQLVALGLRPGMRAFVIEKTPARIRFWANGNEQVLAPVLAESVSVQLLPELRSRDLVEEEFLSGLKQGVEARVIGLSPACRGPERRRLLDLGFVSGTSVTVEMKSPAGDPTAYRVRGTVVALRREQAGLIRIESQKGFSA